VQPEIYKQMARLEKEHFWFRARREILSACLHKYIPGELEKNQVILDAGCGTGGNLQFLSSFGSTFGVDSSRLACGFTSVDWQGCLVQGNLERLPLQSASFSIVSLLDVLEHVDDQHAVLGELFRIMKPNGVLMLTVPAFMHLWSRHDTVHQHRRRYLKSQLDHELVNAGFKVSYLSYYNIHLYPLVALVRLAKKTLKMSESSDMQMPSAWVNCLLYNVFRLERYWIGRLRMPFGVSLVAVATKLNH
jgi:ubiquinone/menaquinone biosynthesis C-methylase UbiE